MAANVLAVFITVGPSQEHPSDTLCDLIVVLSLSLKAFGFQFHAQPISIAGESWSAKFSCREFGTWFVLINITNADLTTRTRNVGIVHINSERAVDRRAEKWIAITVASEAFDHNTA